jgi:hypothetical protein
MRHGARVARSELPADLVTGPFTVARARELGLRAHDLRRRELHRPTHSVRTPTAPTDLAERARSFAVALPPEAAFSHVTAARLLRIPVPTEHEAATVLDVMTRSDRAPTRRKGCRGHRGVESRTVELRSGLRVVCAADTWCDLGELRHPGMSLEDLVVAGDAIVGEARDAAPGAALRAALALRVRPRGARRLTEALDLVRAGVRSPMETRTRLMFVRAGFPEPRVNVPARDALGGWLLEGDLVWEEPRVIAEYQGAVHADRRRRSTDAQRSGLARDEGWTLLEVWAEDVHSPARRRTTLRRFARSLGLDPALLAIR